MRSATALVLLAGIAPASAQDPPVRTAPDETTFSLNVQQGWTLHVTAESILLAVTEKQLTKGLEPQFRTLTTDPTQQPFPPQRRVNLPPPPGTPPRLRASSADTGRPASVTRRSGDPLKLEGAVTMRADGTATFSFKRVEYWDASQRWWIEFEEQKVRAHELGGTTKWSGSRADWKNRLDSLEDSFVQTYLKAVTPHKAEEARRGLGLNVAAQEPAGRRLFVTACLEEQLGVLLLARLDGAALTKTLWPAETAKYPPKAILMARALVERILAQCAGELAPAKARTARSRSVREQPWTGQGPTVPIFPWEDGAAWAAEQDKLFQEAWKRLADLTTRSHQGYGIEESIWRNAVKREIEALQEASKVASLTRTPTVSDAIAPRVLDPGKGTYDYKEDLDLKDGKVVASDAETEGTLKDAEVAFLHSGSNQWRIARARIDTWYKGKVQRK